VVTFSFKIVTEETIGELELFCERLKRFELLIDNEYKILLVVIQSDNKNNRLKDRLCFFE